MPYHPNPSTHISRQWLRYCHSSHVHELTVVLFRVSFVEAEELPTLQAERECVCVVRTQEIETLRCDDPSGTASVLLDVLGPPTPSEIALSSPSARVSTARTVSASASSLSCCTPRLQSVAYIITVLSLRFRLDGLRLRRVVTCDVTTPSPTLYLHCCQ